MLTLIGFIKVWQSPMIFFLIVLVLVVISFTEYYLTYNMHKTGLKKKIRVAHSEDADDAFMFYALTQKIIENNNFEIENILKDIQTLNTRAVYLEYDVQAISFFAYPDIEKDYQLLSCGGALGYGYGPILVSKRKFLFKELKGQTIAVPGEKTTAFLLLKLLLEDFNPVFVPFDKILDSVINEKYPLGLIIHEGQLSYLNYGLNKIIDLGKWWLGKTNLPAPLGGNVIKRSFGEAEKKEINMLLKKSIAYALENKKDIIPKISKYARGIENNLKMVDKFVGMYVDEFTLDYGIMGKLAIKKLYQLAHRQGLIKQLPRLDFVEW